MVSPYPATVPTWPGTVPTIAAPPAATDPGYCVVDVETRDASPLDAERELRLSWSPDPRWKAATIGERFQAAHAKMQERLALCDASPLAAVGILAPPYPPVCLHAIRAEGPRPLSGATVQGFGSERDLCLAVRSALQAVDASSRVIVGHNLRFDAKRLRLRFLACGVQLPACLTNPAQETFDTMREWARMFSLNDDAFVSLADIVEQVGEALNLPRHKDVVTGREVPELVKAGEVDAVVGYNVLDLIAEARLYEAMTGQAGGLA